MLVKKILKVVLLLLSGLFVVFQGLSLGIVRALIGVVILGLLIWLYDWDILCECFPWRPVF